MPFCSMCSCSLIALVSPPLSCMLFLLITINEFIFIIHLACCLSSFFFSWTVRLWFVYIYINHILWESNFFMWCETECLQLFRSWMSSQANYINYMQVPSDKEKMALLDVCSPMLSTCCPHVWCWLTSQPSVHVLFPQHLSQPTLSLA